MRHRLLLALCGVVCAATGWAHDFTYTYQGKTLAYQIESENTCAVTDPDGIEFDRTGDLVIPSTVTHDGVTYTVTAVADYSNGGVGYTSITFPASVREIRFGCFNNCPNLSTLTFEGETPSLDNSFSSCQNVSRINSPYASADGRCVINSEGHLDLCTLAGLTSYSFPEGVKNYGSVIGGQDIESLTLPESTEYIDGYFLGGFPKLSYLEGKFVADDHRTVVIDGTMTYATYLGLTSYTFPEGVTFVDHMASFGGTDGEVESWSLPSSLQVIHPQFFNLAFLNLKYVYGPFSNDDGTTTILNDGESVYFVANVKGLEEFTVPAEANLLRLYTLREIDKLHSIYCNHHIDGTDFYTYQSEPAGTIDLYLSQTTPPAGANMGLENLANIYIPYGSMAAYRAHDYWRDLNNLHEYVPGFSLTADETTLDKHGLTQIAVNLENAENVTALQFDVTLPDCMWFDAMDESVITPTGRLIGHNILANGVDDHTLRVAIYSGNNKAIAGNDGTLLTLAVRTSDWIETDSRVEVVLSNAEATCVNNLREQGLPDWSAWQTVGQDYAEGYAMHIDNQEVRKYGITEVPVYLDNAEGVTAMQFDIVLPDGLTLTRDDEGYDIRKGERLTRSHTITSEDVDGKIRVAIYSSNNATIDGNDGAVALLPIKVENWVGEYTDMPISITDICATRDYDLTELRMPDCEAILTTGASAMLGDANGDGKVTITDVTFIVARILEDPRPNFVEEAADLNGDGKVTITDVTLTINIIMNQPVEHATSRAMIADGMLSIPEFALAVGESTEIEINLDATFTPTALQLDVVLPEGLSVTDANNGRLLSGRHSLVAAESASGCRILCYATDNSPVSATCGEAIRLSVTADSDFAGGEISIINALATDLEGNEHLLMADTTTVGLAGIAKVSVDGEAAYYTIGGIRVSNPGPGTYIEVRDGNARKITKQ